MQQIIGGTLYDTDTAAQVAVLGDLRLAGTASRGFGWRDAALYQTPSGAWFLAGAQAPPARWPRRGTRQDRECIVPIAAAQAQQLLEEYHPAELDWYFPHRAADAGDPWQSPAR